MLTVKDIREVLNSLPDDMEILLESNPEEGIYGTTNQLRTESIKPEGVNQIKRTFLIISDQFS